jgi:hypothetical protein
VVCTTPDASVPAGRSWGPARLVLTRCLFEPRTPAGRTGVRGYCAPRGCTQQHGVGNTAGHAAEITTGGGLRLGHLARSATLNPFPLWRRPAQGGGHCPSVEGVACRPCYDLLRACAGLLATRLQFPVRRDIKPAGR